MKKIVRGRELRVKMEEAINLLCDTVKSTLGPKGSNAIIDHSTFSPFITNDGVTIANNIASDDEVVNTILELAKEASIKTNETVGDGTTSTLVILQSIFNNGLKLINEGTNPIILKEMLFKSLEDVIKEINKNTKVPSKEELINIARVSSNDNEIGDIISDVYFKILNKDAINIKEGDSTITKTIYLKGYLMESSLASMHFLNKEKEIKLDNPYILLINNHLENLDLIANIINNVILTKKNLIIIADSYDNYVVEEIINLNMERNISVILLNNPLYGLKKLDLYQDLSVISNAKVVTNFNNVDLDCLGIISNISIDNDNVVFNFKFNNQVKERMIELNNLLNSASDDKSYLAKRIAMFEKGSASILVGGLTKTERREKKMRYDDALWAISEASKGVTVGSGILESIISDKIDDNTLGDKLLKIALKEPLKVIYNNAGLNFDEIYSKIKDSNYKLLYNVKKGEFEDIENTIVIDPASVIMEAISNATSIAAMLLTTDSIIINELQNNLNKSSEFGEI